MTQAPRTNYEAIAPSYDEDRKDWDIPLDEIVASGSVRDVLDIGCGTGLWLITQRVHEDVRFTGLDPSAGMLAEAHRKDPDIRLVNAYAEAIPFAPASFDYIYTSFVYHHFTDKPSAFDEIARVLRPCGTLRIRNIDPANMEGWWVYRYFPRTRALDELRFWTAGALTEALERRGFNVDAQTEMDTTHSPALAVVEEAARRVVSQLAILDDDEYNDGLERLRAMDEPIQTDWAVLTITAVLDC